MLVSTLSAKGSGATFVLGGFLYVVGSPGDVERYDVTTNTWVAVADMLESRFAAVNIGAAGPAEEQDLFDSLIAKATSARGR
jgi:hypothetical protein